MSCLSSAFPCFLFLQAMAFSPSSLFSNLSSVLPPSALSPHSPSSALFTFHLSALTRLSAVLSSRCCGDAFTGPIVIESYEYFSPIVQLCTTSSPVIYLSASHHDPPSLPSSVFSLTPSSHHPFSFSHQPVVDSHFPFFILMLFCACTSYFFLSLFCFFIPTFSCHVLLFVTLLVSLQLHPHLLFLLPYSSPLLLIVPSYFPTSSLFHYLSLCNFSRQAS